MKKLLYMIFALALTCNLSACGDDDAINPPTEQPGDNNNGNSDDENDSGNTENNLKLSDLYVGITSNGNTVDFRLYETKAAQQFYDQLPLDLQLSNFRDAQWMFYPPNKLDVTDAEAYHDGKKGELSYYAPWGDVFMLYKDFYAGDEMHRLGVLVSGVDEIESMSGNVRIEKTTNNGGNEENPDPSDNFENMNLKITIGDRELTATFANNETAKDFALLLPLTVNLNDYASTEKVFDLSRKLSTTGAPAGIDPEIGDITYYSPWGNIAIFYRDFSYSSGLVKIAHIDSGIDNLQVSGSINNVKFELIEKE